MYFHVDVLQFIAVLTCFVAQTILSFARRVPSKLASLIILNALLLFIAVNKANKQKKPATGLHLIFTSVILQVST